MSNTAVTKKPSGRSGTAFAGICLAAILLMYFFSAQAPGDVLANPKLQIFKTVLVSILLEAMPFILIGVLSASAVHVFVPDRIIRRIIPRNPVLGILVACLLGIVFPLCECGMVPAVRKLIDKGMPLYAATAFILTGPILNPIVFWSTWIAFRARPELAIARMGLGFAVALIVGLIVYRFVRPDQLKLSGGSHNQGHHHDHHDHQHTHDHHAHDHGHSHDHGRGRSKWMDWMEHSVSEFFDMGRYLIIGSVLVALLQTFVTQQNLVALGHGQGSSNVMMMGLAFLLSLCSTSDAFVAQSFLTTFSAGSLIAFMVFGPMLNLKGLMMMLAVFKTRFVAIVGSLVFVLVLAGTLLLDTTLWR